MHKIQHPSRHIVSRLLALKKKKTRKRERKMYLEGIHLCEECVRLNFPVIYFGYTSALFNTKRGESLFREINSKDYMLYRFSDTLMKRVTDTMHSQGIIAVTPVPDHRLRPVSAGDDQVWIYLDGVRDPGNLGTMIRNADAFGAGSILLSPDSVDPFNPKVIRTTMGGILRIPVLQEVTVDQLEALQSKSELRIICCETGGSSEFDSLSWKGNIILVFGNETKGIGKEVSALKERSVRIPMEGKADSLNMGVAAGIIMYHVRKWKNDASMTG
jgi:TrmH family RNA methyltransferase